MLGRLSLHMARLALAVRRHALDVWSYRNGIAHTTPAQRSKETNGQELTDLKIEEVPLQSPLELAIID